jgi:signal transduction histidine kinase
LKWWSQINLSKRIIAHVAILELLTILIGAIAIWYAVGFRNTVNTLVDRQIKALEAAREMENALANQKGFVTYYFLDGDPKWLQELSNYREIFRNWLETAEKMNQDPAHAELIAQISLQYQKYIRNKDRIIEMYRSGDRQKGEQMHWDVRNQFFELNRMCRLYKRLNEEEIYRFRESVRDKSARMASFVVAGLIVSVVFGVFMAFLLIVQVIGPIRRLAEMAPEPEEQSGVGNEVALLGDRVRGMIADMDRTHSELKQSQELLIHSEKMALVGKLATEVAHSIRSPMTSINMRLFSLQRSLDLTENQSEDFEVVAEEMRRLDNIVRNFLEFSRPPKLHKQKTEISWIISMTLELLEYRLKRHDVEVIRKRAEFMPPAEADPELMKEVFVNLIVNACEAMGEGGKIFIEESLLKSGGRACEIQISIRDTGPGIPEEAKHQILEPFHSTKTQGTGLGLFITSRIIREHGGRLDLQSAEGRGATFIVTLPISEGISDG